MSVAVNIGSDTEKHSGGPLHTTEQGKDSVPALA